MHIEKLDKGIVLLQDDLLSNLIFRVLLVKEVVKLTDDHKCNEILGDVENGERLCDDDIIVQERDQHDRRNLEEPSCKRDLIVLEAPVMVQRILHLGHTFFQFSGHGYVHHDTGNESCKSDVA